MGTSPVVLILVQKGESLGDASDDGDQIAGGRLAESGHDDVLRRNTIQERQHGRVIERERVNIPLPPRIVVE